MIHWSWAYLFIGVLMWVIAAKQDVRARRPILFLALLFFWPIGAAHLIIYGSFNTKNER